MIKIQLSKTLKGSEKNFRLKVNLSIDKYSFSTFSGSSGAGKTTVLRLLSGLSSPDEGSIEVNGETWFDSSKKINLPPQKRRIGYVFQDYALFPNMTVLKNLEFALEKKDKTYLEYLLQITGLTELQHRKPDTLSGGQKQRVALARALVRKPEILLLDEPLSALDTQMRNQLQDEILKIHRELKITTVLVSHDYSEIYKLSDKVFQLQNGEIINSGTPAQVFSKDKISGKFRFTGEVLDISKNDVIYILTVAIGNNIVKVVATEEEIKELEVGDRVMVASKAFNPIIIKLS